uniref:ATP-grasp domain-containing protein n=1 Tax=Ditylenchus dipsaci TaxID=166011 RepID=A0A915ER23_9BILA
MSTVNEKQLSTLEELNASKRVVVVLIKWKYPFFTELQNFQKPRDAGLVGIFAEQTKAQMFEGFDKHFDLIFWYKADYTLFEGVYCDSNTIFVPEVTDLVQKISINKLKLLDTEEFMIDFLCQLRKDFGIAGPLKEDLEPLRNKAMLKTCIHKAGIPTAKFSIVHFESVRNQADIQSAIQETIQQIGQFPMFRKPISGCGSGGGGQLASEQELERWMKEEVDNGQKGTYLIEECMVGREFWAMVCLLPSKKWRPLMLLHCGDTPVGESLRKGLPMKFIGRRFEHFEDEFPRMEKFVDEVIRVLKPPHPHQFCVQGFQLKPKTSDYFFTECGYRLNGARGSGVSHGACGVSLETALLQCHMDLGYQAEVDPSWGNLKEAQVWWPYNKGFIRSHNTVPADAPINSSVELRWKMEVGDKMCDPNRSPTS